MNRYQYQAHLHWLIAESRCVHCGEPSDAIDTAVPELARRPIFHMLAKVGATGLPTCRECMDLANRVDARTIGEKRRAIHHWLAVRYGRVLELPAWNDAELDALGYNLKTDVEAGQIRRREIEARIMWPRSRLKRSARGE